MKLITRLALLLALPLAVALSGCGIDTTEVLAPPQAPAGGGGGGGGSGSAVSYSAQIEPILLNFCSLCHNDSTSSGGNSVDSYASLFPPTSNSNFVVAGDSASSHMIIRLDAGTMPPAGNSAPSQAQIDLIRDWIDQGALNN